MNVGHTEIFVHDPLKSKNFYADVLGFQLDQIQNDQFVWLTLNSMTVLLRPFRRSVRLSSYQEAPSAIVFYTDDLKNTVRALESRGLEFKGKDGSDKCLTFTDIDGNWFQLVNPEDH